MKIISTIITRTLNIAAASVLALNVSDATAAVKYRIGFDSAANAYAVYMTPDSTPSPDMLLSAQVTVVVPHGTSTKHFDISNISSTITGVNWADNSRVDAPKENTTADYISLSYYFSGSKVPAFGWIAGQEKKVFTFSSNLGCVAGVKLIDSKDPFNQLPNSAGTNPGNDFLNVGWKATNAYVGNYGNAVSCATATTAPVCTPTAQDKLYLSKISTLEAMKIDASVTRQTEIDTLIARLKASLSCKA